VSLDDYRAGFDERVFEVLDLKPMVTEKPDAKPTPPAPSATPLTGETTLDDGVRMETDIVSYKAMAEAAHAVVSDIDDRLRNNAGAKKPISNLAIYDAQVVKDWRFFQALFPAFHGQTEDILNSYKNLVCFNAQVDANFKQKYCERSPGAHFARDERIAIADFQAGAIQTAFSVGGDLVKSFIDLAALFRTETKITGKSLTIDETALTAEVFRVFKSEKPDTNLYYPRMFPPRVNPNGQSKTLQEVGMLFIFKSEADRLIKLETDQQAALADSIKVQIKEKAQLEPELVQTYSQLPIITAAVDWCRGELPSWAIEFVRTFVPGMDLDLGGGATLKLFHGTPRSHMEDMLATTPPEALEEMLGDKRAVVMAGGHTHIQMLRQYQGILIVNAGSVGAPFKEFVDHRPPTIMPYAEYATVEAEAGGVQVTLRRVLVDKRAMWQAAIASSNPLAPMMAQQYA